MAKVMVGIDFGTSNSGAIIGLYNNSDCSSFRTINHNLVDNYAKEPTYLLVKTDLLESDSNDNLIQNVKYELGNGNILFGQKAVEYCLENDSTEYVHFYDLKMNLYDDKNYVLGHIEGTEEGKEYDIVTIISIYISCLKTTVLDYLQTVPWGNVLEEDIKWAISIPAIWNDCAKKKMEDVCENVFGTTIVKVLEPEAACIYVLKTRDQETHAGEKYLVVDMGGGTTDIVGFELKEDASGDIYCEECVKHDGLPIAGRKIDKLFWQFFAEKLCNGIEKYNNWSPKVKYDKIIGSYFAHLDCKLEMEAYWETIKRCQDFVSDFEFDFKIPNGYIQWLDNNDFREIVDGLEKKSGRVVDYRLTLKSEEIRIRVYDPIKKEIIDIVKQKIEETTGNYNKIILTGGLSCNRYIQSEIRNALGDTVYYSYDDGASTNFKAGGAVLYGIPAMIIDGILMKRRSTLFYYVDVCIKTDTNTVKDDGLQFYFMCQYGLFTNAILDELQKEEKYYDYIKDENDKYNVFVLDPICKANATYTEYNESFTPTHKDQKIVEFNIYSSENICFLHGREQKRNPNVRLEGTAKVPLNGHRTVWCKVDFNTVQDSYWTAYISYEKDGTPVCDIRVYHVLSNYGH